MELKDVIHFYLGCQAKVKRKIDNEYHIGKICEVTKNSNHGNWIEVNFEHIIEVTGRTYEKSSSNMHTYFLSEDNIYLVLRPMQYLTEEEIEHVLWLIHDSETHLGEEARISKEEINGCIESIDPDDDAIVVNHTIRCFAGKLYLSSHSGYLRLYEECEEDDQERPIEWKPELYAYLCKQGIDIFNLITSNQAINSTEL